MTTCTGISLGLHNSQEFSSPFLAFNQEAVHVLLFFWVPHFLPHNQSVQPISGGESVPGLYASLLEDEGYQ